MLFAAIKEERQNEQQRCLDDITNADLSVSAQMVQDLRVIFGENTAIVTKIILDTVANTKNEIRARIRSRADTTPEVVPPRAAQEEAKKP